MKTSVTSFSDTINGLIVEFHKLYHDYKKPIYLEIAGILGKVKTVDNTPHPLPEALQ